MSLSNESNVYVQQIDADQLDHIIFNESHIIVDVRNTKAIANQGAIPNAINIPLDMIDDATNMENPHYNSVFSHKKPVLFCCTGGVMSYMAALKVKKNGMSEVFNLNGGHSAWLKLKESQTI